MLAAISNSWPSIMNGVSSVASRSCATRAGGRAGVALEVGQQEHELVAAVAGEQVGRAGAAGEPRGDLAQQLVAGGVPERVVDELEVVEVDVEHGGGAAVAARAGERQRRVLLELGAVGEAGQRVVVGHVPHVLLGGALRR